ncbi:MAG TPA: amino acid ABC transporter substrate-binding protein, partial [Candidatus Scatomorpha stercorigallinarum]|nr:amino acid ABC transporter substrate-binding protein [Candidatus Scatomorpha stercorigallinarum]
LAGSTDPVAIKDALWDVNYDGITGNITFGENGDAVRDTAYIKISDNVAVAWTDGGTQTVA